MDSQGEDFVPLWVQVLVHGVSLQPVVIQLQYTEGIALTYKYTTQYKPMYRSIRYYIKYSTGCITY